MGGFPTATVCRWLVLRAYPIISPRPFGGRGVGGEGDRVTRIAAGFLDGLRQSLALTPTLSRRERGTFWDRFLVNAGGVEIA